MCTEVTLQLQSFSLLIVRVLLYMQYIVRGHQKVQTLWHSCMIQVRVRHLDSSWT